ncbi:MAG: hypothetical protein WED00_00215 [Aquisalimonadaceae bacterium]
MAAHPSHHLLACLVCAGLVGLLALSGCRTAPNHWNGKTEPFPEAADRPSDSPDMVRSIKEWEATMASEGRRLGEKLLSLPDASIKNPDGATLKEVYYDGQLVFYQIAEYLGANGAERQRWHAYAERARDIYVLGYLKPNQFAAAGYMRFAHGLYEEWRLTGNEAARQWLIRLRDDPPYSSPSQDSNWHLHKYSREIAYAIQANVLAEKAGEPRQAERVNALIEMALGHVRIWTTGDYLDGDPEWHFVQAFMAGLTASALIDYHDHTPDKRIPPAMKTLADWLWDTMWVPSVEGSGYGAFKYVNRMVENVGGPEPAPDLNLLIAPLYAWLYREFGDPVYRDRADRIFVGGVALTRPDNGKRFNQNYRSSFSYLRWRQQGLQRWQP